MKIYRISNSKCSYVAVDEDVDDNGKDVQCYLWKNSSDDNNSKMTSVEDGEMPPTPNKGEGNHEIAKMCCC